MVVAVTDEAVALRVSATEVEYEIRQGTKGDYARAAELVNYKDVRWVSLQHEYGIFGGDDGAYILDFLGALRVPAVVTLAHRARQPRRRLAAKRSCRRWPRRRVLVVMSQVAADLLARRYELHERARRHHPARHPRHGAARPGRRSRPRSASPVSACC